jgi:hypothetical protein
MLNILGWNKKESLVLFFKVKGSVDVFQRTKALHFPLGFFK